MRVIGLVGGMSWQSSAAYYRLINEEVRTRLGGQHNARSLLYTVDFAAVEVLQREGRWEEAGELLADAARRLERGGADCVVLCTNTMHKLAHRIEAAVGIPLLHIVDATAHALVARGLDRVGLLGTAFTMEQDFYRGRLRDRFGVEATVPGEADRALVHRIIYDELCQGIVRPESRAAYTAVMRDLAGQGAQAIVLGCTEIMLLVGQADTSLPLFDSAALHAAAAVDFALA
ncbi:MAG: aspartate/glutamate racemase family protein [Vicinamibacteria bacterium]